MAKCATCKDVFWVCEDHPDQSWGLGDGLGIGEGCCGAPGVPCPACNRGPAVRAVCEGEIILMPAQSRMIH